MGKSVGERVRSGCRDLHPAFRWMARVAAARLLPWAERLTGFRTMPGDGLAERWEMVLGARERDTVRWVRRLAWDGGVFLDVGANVGYHSVLAARCGCRWGKILAVEPNPRVFPVLESNCRRHRVIRPERLALGGRAGGGSLHVHSRESTSGSLHGSFVDARAEGLRHAGIEGEIERHEVRVCRGDDFLAEAGVGSLALLKVDVEGAEVEVLEGLERTLARSEDVAVLVEANAESARAAGRDPTVVWAFLKGAGFRVYSSGDDRLERPLEDGGEVERHLCAGSDAWWNLLALRGGER